MRDTVDLLPPQGGLEISVCPGGIYSCFNHISPTYRSLGLKSIRKGSLDQGRSPLCDTVEMWPHHLLTTVTVHQGAHPRVCPGKDSANRHLQGFSEVQGAGNHPGPLWAEQDGQTQPFPSCAHRESALCLV